MYSKEIYILADLSGAPPKQIEFAEFQNCLNGSPFHKRMNLPEDGNDIFTSFETEGLSIEGAVHSKSFVHDRCQGDTEVSTVRSMQ